IRNTGHTENLCACCLGHPVAPILATSGIDPVVRIWQPLPEDGAENPRHVQDFDTVVQNNQQRIHMDPMDLFARYGALLSISFDQF
ncbi:MAG: hypothetical protein ACK56F_02145, partial [bacterium]